MTLLIFCLAKGAREQHKVATKALAQKDAEKNRSGCFCITSIGSLMMNDIGKQAEELVNLLREKKRRLWTEVRHELFDQIGDELHAEYEIPQDAEDRALIDLLEDTGLAVADIRRQELTRIDEAMQRLEQGRYGLCEDCGRAIRLERLRVDPYVSCCIECQEKREASTSSGAARTL